MMKNKLKDKANSYFDKGSYRKAAKEFKKIYDLDPYNEKSMLIRAARCFELLKQNDVAISIYIQVAKEYAESGFLLKAIASLKNVLELSPNHIETQSLIADLYAKNGKIYESKKENSPFIKNDSDFKTKKELLLVEEDVMDAEAYIIEDEDDFIEGEVFNTKIDEPIPPIKLDTIDASTLIKPLPEIPLFSKLDRDIFIDLMNKIELKTYREGSLIIKEGDEADALYIILSGEVKVIKEIDDSRTIEVARLNDGEFFGEMALLGNSLRTASIEATKETELFIITKSILDDIMLAHVSVRKILFKFYRNRLLYNIINFSPMFQKIEKSKRLALIKRFKSKRLFANQVIIEQNGALPGLFLILEGKIKVYRFLDKTTRQDIITLSQGAILGEMSFLKKCKPMAYCSTIAKTWVLRLPAEEYDYLNEHYPEVVTYLKSLKEDREYELDLLGKLNIGIY